MATIDQAQLGIDLEELENIRADRPLPKPLVPAHQAPAPAVETAAPQRIPGRNNPPANYFRAVLWQGLKTTAPLVGADLLALFTSGFVADLSLRVLNPSVSPVLAHMGFVVLLLIVCAYWICGLYSSIGVNPVLELRQLIQINSIGFVAAAAGGMLAQPLPVWCLLCWLASIALVPFFRATARRWCSTSDWWGHPTLIINCGKCADAVSLALLRAPTSGFRPIAVTSPQGECRSTFLPVVNDPAALETLVRARTIRYAVVCAPDLPGTALNDIFNRYTPLIPHLIVLSDAPDLPNLWGTSRSCGRLSGTEMRNGRMLPSLWVVKRIIDVAVAGAALFMSMPLLAAIALAVKLTSRGPIFYGHSRIGMSGRWFMAWKFRTMHPNSDQVLREYLQKHPEAREEWDRDHKLKHDPRVTPIGQILRKSSLDELPQVWNVLRGEMSLVGPRPIVATEVCKYGNVFKKYSAVKPGITGMWQVSGRSEISYDERVRLDEFYIANWSPWLDVYILAKTIVVLMRRRGAY